MPLRVVNESDVDRLLDNAARSLYRPSDKKWFVRVVKDYILNCEGAERTDLFKPYSVDWKRSALDGLPAVLPTWVAEALQRGEDVYVFNELDATRGRSQVWKRIQRLVMWLNGRQPPATFLEADCQATEWAAKI